MGPHADLCISEVLVLKMDIEEPEEFIGAIYGAAAVCECSEKKIKLERPTYQVREKKITLERPTYQEREMKTSKEEGGANKAKRQSLDSWRKDKIPYKRRGIVIRRESYTIWGRSIWGKSGGTNATNT